MRVLRYEIPLDGKWHDVELSGPVVRTAFRNDSDDVMHIWALADVGTPFRAVFRIFGTGHPVPDNAVYRGTAISEPYVWHLFEAA
jgi:hypothetical protein